MGIAGILNKARQARFNRAIFNMQKAMQLAMAIGQMSAIRSSTGGGPGKAIALAEVAIKAMQIAAERWHHDYEYLIKEVK